MSDMDPLYELMKDSAEDMSEAAVEMKRMMTSDANTDVDIQGYGPKPSFSKQLDAFSDKYIAEMFGQDAGFTAGFETEAEARNNTLNSRFKIAFTKDTGAVFFWDASTIPTQAETTALLARMATAPTAIQTAAINRLFYDLKTAGVFSKLDALWMGVNTSEADSYLNFVANALTLTPNGGVSYSAAAGWQFSGENWLSTGFNPATAGGKYGKDSASFGVLVADAINTGTFMGAYNGISGLSLSRQGSTLTGRLNSGAAITGTINPAGTSLFSVSRVSDKDVSLYVGHTKVAAASIASDAPINTTVTIGRSRNDPLYYTTARIAAAYIGSGLTAIEILALNDAIRRYLVNFRATSLPAGNWVQSKFFLQRPDLVSAEIVSVATSISDKKTQLLNNAIIAYPTYSALTAAEIASTGVRALDESTGVIYSPETLPSAVLEETTAFIARMATAPTAAQAAAINQLIYLLKKDGIWDALDALYLGINTSYNDSLLNLVQNAYNLTTTIAPTWAQQSGWFFSRPLLSYLDTGYNPSTAGGKLQLDDASFGALMFPSTPGVASGHIMGAFDGTNGIALAPMPNETTVRVLQARLNQSTPLIGDAAGSQNAVYAVSREGGTIQAWREGVLVASATMAPTSLVNRNILLGCSQVSSGYHMYDNRLAAAFIGSSLTGDQVGKLTRAIRRYNDVFRGNISPTSAFWSPTGRKVYSDADIVAIAGTAGGSSDLEPPESAATVNASLSLTLSAIAQTFRGGYIEIQPDSFIGGTEPATDSATALWGFPQSLTLSEQDRLRDLMLPGNGYGIQYLRLPLGFAYRGFRNIDPTTGLAKNIGERYPGQNAALKRLMQNVVRSGGGLAPEYWCPAPYWMTNGKYAGTPTSYNQPWAGGSYPRSTTLDSIKGGDPTQYAAQIEAMSNAMLDDFEYLHQNVGPVRMYGLQNEPQYGHELYGVCKYTDRVYSDLLAALQPKIAASAILSEWDGQANSPLLHVASDNDWHIGQTYTDSHADKIWGYSHHNITAIATDADWLKSSTFINLKGSKKNVFVNETEYMYPQNTSNDWKCANNMLRDLHNLVFGGAEVSMPVIHLCKQLGESTSYTSNTDGYAIMKCNLPVPYGVAPGSAGNEAKVNYGTFGVNEWNYNAHRLLADNLPVGSLRVGGEPAISTAGIGIAAFMVGGKLKLFLVNRNSGAAAITVSLGAFKRMRGKHYDLSHAGDSLSDKSGSDITFVLPAYCGQCWAEI